MYSRIVPGLAGLALLATGAATSAFAEEINLYTTREPGLIRPLLDSFTKASGIKVNTVLVDKGLAERVAAEGERSPADVLMTVDIGNLVELVDKGLSQPTKSSALEGAIPAALRDKDGHWYALSMRARLIYADPALNLTAVTYEDLADPKWKGKICIRSGQHPYNTALISAFVIRHGEAKTEEWLRAVKANLARKPGGGDREVARDIKADLCDLGVANSYYVGLMRSGKGGPDQQTWGDAIATPTATFQGGGTHVNVSGAVVAKHAKNKDGAVKLLEYLVSDEAQDIYARGNFEYPVRASAKLDPVIEKVGKVVPDTTPLADIARGRKAASVLIDKVGFDN
jgi:iron(III) transport system substrate-binding protein